MSGARVLVVDDEPQILRALQIKLRDAGYRVDTAATASEARIKASMRPPEAMILDVLLPDGRGTDVCRELRSWSDRADPRALGRRGGAGEDRGARCGRGRLRHEAVQR